MEDLSNRVNHLDLTLDLGDLITKDRGSSKLVIATWLLSQHPVNQEAFLGVSQKNWIKTGYLDMKVVD